MLLLPLLMPFHQQGFDLPLVPARCQFLVSKSTSQIVRGVVVGMIAIPTDDTGEGLLVRSIGPIHVVAAHTLLRGVGSLDRMSCSATFGGGPADLFWDVCQVRGVQIGVHRSCLEAHRRDREVLVDETSVRMLRQHLIHSLVDGLSHMTSQPLPGRTTGRGQLLCALFLEACSELRFATALLPVTLLALPQGAVKAPVMLAGRGGQKVGDAYIHADRWGGWLGFDRNVRIEREGQPPDTVALVERGRGIEGVPFQSVFLIGGESDRDPQWVALV